MALTAVLFPPMNTIAAAAVTSMNAVSTSLGGSTTVGDHCVIGGNVWLTHSVEPGQTVYYRAEPSDRG